MKEIKINFKESSRGLSVKFNDKNYDIVFPRTVWKEYPKDIKAVWIDNFALLSTICSPLVAGVQAVEYNTSLPIFKPLFYKMVLNSMPSATEDYAIPTKKAIKQFKKIRYIFKDNKIKKPSYKSEKATEEKGAIVPLSCGKDSLLTLAICNEIGLNPAAIYINDTVDPVENEIVIRFCKKLSTDRNIVINFVTNNIEKLNDFRFWNKTESSLGYSHMMTGFCFIALPFSHYYKAKYIIPGDEKNMDWSFINKEDYKAWPSEDQTSQWIGKQNNMIRLMTSNKVSVTSLVRPLTSIAITKILHSRYSEFARYEISCYNLSEKTRERWCHNCPTCVTLSLFMLANGINPKNVGLGALLSKKYEKFYRLFNGEKIDCYEKSKEARDQQMLAFYLAYKNKARGYLIEKFKKRFLSEATRREDELRKKFFKVYKANIPKEIKRDVVSIFKEELKELV